MRVRKLLGDSLLGLLVTAGLVVGLELVLAALGLGEAATSLSRGFDPLARYFVADPEEPGGYRTQFFKNPKLERRIAPKGERVRILLFGGSNTAGFPAGHLARTLNKAGTGRRYEVINLGRSGYGSERVAILFRQALERLAPDVVVVYSGHNEFMERGFRMDLEATWSSKTLARFAGAAQRTRTVSFLAELFSTGGAGTHRDRPEEWTSEYDKFEGLTYDRTRLYFDAYGANLRAMCSSAVERGVDVVLSTVVHNRFAPPFMSTLPAELSAADARRFDELHGAAAERIPALLEPVLPTEEGRRLHQYNWLRPRPGQEPLSRADLPALRPSLGALEHQEPLWPDPERWDRKVKTVYDVLARFFARDLAPGHLAGARRAAELLDEALAIAPEHARARFERGMLAYLLGEESAAVARHLELAARYDCAPRKANGATNDVVLAVAGDVPGVHLLDADRLFAGRVPGGLFGWEWMTDHCHLNEGAATVLMEDLAQVIVSERLGLRPGE